MKKRGSKGDNTSSKTKGLQQEAADMEVKLLELRKAMEAERVRRENIMSTATNGSLWRNGGNGLLRSNFRNKQNQGAATGGPGSPASSAADASNRSASAPRDPATAAAAAAEARALGMANASPSMRSARSPAPDGARSPVPRLPPDVSVVGSAATTRRPPDVLSVHQPGPGPAVGGTGCGADDDDDISSGAFNEADSHRSFMEALNEWRNAQRGAEPQAAASSSGHAQSSQPGASMEVQTDTSNKAPRPPSATKKSYFEKLALNTASRHAGECATGGPSSQPQHLEPGSTSRPASSARSTLPPAATASERGVAAEPSSLEQHMATLDRLEQLEQQRQQEAERGCLDEDEDEEVVVAQTVVSMGLVKGMHLPDAILLPDHTSEAIVKDD